MSIKRSWQYQKVYSTRQWRKLRENVLNREPLCRICKKNGDITAATHVDHIVPLKKTGMARAFDISNLRSLCKKCHSEITARANRKPMTESEKAWKELVKSPVD